MVNKSLILSNFNPDSGDHDWKEILEYRDWSVLKFFSLSKANNNVGWCIIDSDVEFLGRLRWPNLNHLTLSTYYLTQVLIR